MCIGELLVSNSPFQVGADILNLLLLYADLMFFHVY